MNSAITVKKPTDRLLFLTTESEKMSTIYNTSGRTKYGLMTKAVRGGMKKQKRQIMLETKRSFFLLTDAICLGKVVLYQTSLLDHKTSSMRFYVYEIPQLLVKNQL